MVSVEVLAVLVSAGIGVVQTGILVRIASRLGSVVNRSTTNSQRLDRVEGEVWD